ncbi:glycoside hydrolase family 66 protein [Paenibacillus sp. V4I7]|uniref:glycoside hydrolase family 66 protein n=1 Tax=Paenibacillus sp. V4I7 TaxID=3042307 RepID=UPI0027898C3C|nr:glycoside hydrolase family 66 protein [Paenibacillus sp. V4I7]MDQ0901246.1 hypothetical protein [Paenibacillus sp. V4I7]
MAIRSKWFRGLLAGFFMLQTVAFQAGSAVASDAPPLIKMEAESGQAGWEPVVAKTGGVSVEYGRTDEHGHTGQTLIFNVDMKKEASELVFHYRTGNNPVFDVIVDDTVIAHEVTFGQTQDGWSGGMVEKAIKAPALITASTHNVKLVMVSEGQYVHVDSLEVAGQEYEAEDATLVADTQGRAIKTKIGYIYDFKKESDFLTFDVSATNFGPMDLVWKYKNDGSSQRVAKRTLYVNDVKQENVTFPYSGDVWGSLTIPQVPLLKGSNRITIKIENQDDDGVKLDFLKVGTLKYQAEKANFVPPMNIYKNLLLNFGHIGDVVNFNIHIQQAGETSLIFTYANAASASTKTLYLDGNPVIGGDGKPVKIWFNGTGSRDKFNEDTYYIVPYLAAGSHTVTLKHDSDDKGTIDLRRLTLGYFSEPSIRLMDAGLAAMGATHIELGTAEMLEEGPNMLASEYYPNRSKKMKTSLKQSMKDYYKFLTAYENVLFDSKEDRTVNASVYTKGGDSVAVSEDGASNTLWTIARKNTDNTSFGRYDILHLINLLNNDDNWRNAANAPAIQSNLKVTYPVGTTQAAAPNLKVYAASPDHDGGLLKELPFAWHGTNLDISLPSLQYWELILIDRDGTGLGQGSDTSGSATTPIQNITVGQARYNPSEEAVFHVQVDQSTPWSGNLQVEFYQLNRLVGTKTVAVSQGAASVDATWTPPTADFQGYLVKAYVEGHPGAYKTAALDVSSDWTHFPRYGYVTEFPQETAEQSDAKLKQLSTEYYLNGYQFYDWMWRHDVSVYSKVGSDGKPLKDEQGNFITENIAADSSYTDLLGRHLYPKSIMQEVTAAQKYGSAAMAYEMNYAAREKYEDFGVKREWGLYNKNATFPNPDLVKYQNGFFFDWVSPPTALYLQDPGNTEWQAYITKQFDRAVNVFGFDGIHLDQWGASDSDFLYSYAGNPRYYSLDYNKLINSVKDSLTTNNSGKNYVAFNMVGGNAGYSTVPSSNTKTDFDYSEIWQDKDQYKDLKQVIDDTRQKDGYKAMVIAGYMNYKQAVGDHYEVADVVGVPKTTQFISRIAKAPGWVGDFGKKDEDQIIWTVNVPETGDYNLDIKYGHGNDGGNPNGKLSVNGNIVAPSIPFTQKTGWGNPIADAVVHTTLQAGTNTVTLQLNTSDLWLNVDSLDLSGTVKGASVQKVYEAEYAQLVSCHIDNIGNVYNFETDGDFIAFDVNVPMAGSYDVAFNYGIESTPVRRNILVNDQPAITDVSFASTGDWDTYKEQSVSLALHEGHNTITLKTHTSDSGMKVDRLHIGSDRYEAENAAIGWNPTQAAQIQVHPEVSSEIYVNNITNAPDYVEFNVTTVTEGTYQFGFKYATQNNATAVISVNGVEKATNAAFKSTTRWGGDGKWGLKTVDLPLQTGMNKIRLALTSNGQYVNLDNVLVQPLIIAVDDSQHVSATGGVALTTTGIDAKTDNFNGDPTKSVSFTLDASDAGPHTLGFMYRSGNSNTGVVNVNGSDIPVTLPDNDWYGNDGNWSYMNFPATLNQGRNTITLTLNSTNNWLNLHALVMETGKIEAEGTDTTVNGITKGTYWLDDFGKSGDSITFAYHRAEAGTVPVVFTYKAGTQGAYQLEVNGTTVPVSFAATNDWQTVSVDVTLQLGSNTLKLVPASNQQASILLDKLTIGTTDLQAEAAVLAGSAAVETVAADRGYIYDFKQQGDFFTLSTGPVSSDGSYNLTFKYRNKGSDTKRSVYINDQKAGVVTLAGGTTDWAEAVIPVYVSSKSSNNAFKIKMEEATEQTGIDIDSLTLAYTTQEPSPVVIPWLEPSPPVTPTPTPLPSPDPVTVPSVNPPSTPSDTVVVNNESLKNAKGGKFEVELKNAEKKVLLSVSAVKDYITDRLVLTKGKQKLTIPSSILNEAAVLASSESNAQITVTINDLDAAPFIPSKNSNTKIAAVGTILELSIQVMKDDKVLGTVSQFQNPVELSISYEGSNAKENLLGIYYFNESKQVWEYVGGTIDKVNKKVMVQLNHFSKYALIEYVKSFNDVPSDHWASEAVQTLAAKQIVDGKTDSMFDPDGQTTRAEFAALLVRALGLKETKAAPFQDVHQSAWYADVVSAAFEAGLISGKNDTNFAPQDLITREEMSTMIVRAMEYKSGKAISGDAVDFVDTDQISDWAKSFVGKAASAGLMQGPGGQRFDPLHLAKRSETAQVIFNLFQQ